MGLPQPNDAQRQTSHARTQLLTSDSVALWHYPQLKLIHHEMRRVPESAEFRELLMLGAGLVERFRANKWLSDDRGNTVVRDSDEEWAERLWLPRVLKAGFEFWAIVPPDTAVGKLNMRRLAEGPSRRGVTSCVVESPEAGLEWLLSQ